MYFKINRIFLIIFFFFSYSINSAKAVTFKNFGDLYECVKTYNTFFGYKKNLKTCFQKQNITIENDSLKLIKKNSGIIENIIVLDLPKKDLIKKPKKKLSKVLSDIFKPDLKKIEEKESIFNKPTTFSENYNKENQFNLNDKDFKKLNNHIKKNPEDIFAITEDINILTYKFEYLTEFKRQEILLNVYNTFDVSILASKVPPPSETAFENAGIGIAALAIAAGAGGGGGGGSPAPTLSFTTSSNNIGECDSDVTITANLTKAHSSNVIVSYAVGGTATLNTDYTLSSTTSVIAAGATSASIILNQRHFDAATRHRLDPDRDVREPPTVRADPGAAGGGDGLRCEAALREADQHHGRFVRRPRPRRRGHHHTTGAPAWYGTHGHRPFGRAGRAPSRCRRQRPRQDD